MLSHCTSSLLFCQGSLLLMGQGPVSASSLVRRKGGQQAVPLNCILENMLFSFLLEINQLNRQVSISCGKMRGLNQKDVLSDFFSNSGFLLCVCVCVCLEKEYDTRLLETPQILKPIAYYPNNLYGALIICLCCNSFLI